MLEKLEDKFVEERLQLEKAPRATGGVETTGGGRCSTAALRVIKPSKYVYLSRMNLGFRQQPFGI